MSGSLRRRHSKWDHKDSDALTENFQDKSQTRRPREPFSPSRGSQRHDSRSKERMMTWDSEGNNPRMSTGPGESRQHLSRSPRNGWGRLHSRSRSRSRSPSHHLRREPVVNDRSRSRSGVSAQVCREFVAGRCRRGSTCHFLHQDAQSYETDSRQPLDSSQPDDWESRHRRVGGSKYSPVDKDYSPRTEKSLNICSDFLKGRCRRGTSCRLEHRDLVSGSFKESLIDDAPRDRDISHKNRDTYFHRNHDREPVDVFEKRHADDRDKSHRNRDTYSHRNPDREPVDMFEKGHDNDRDNSHRARDTHSRRIDDRGPVDVFEKGLDDDRGRDNSYRSRDTYSHRHHDREPADVFEKGIDVLEKGHVDDRDRGSSRRSRDIYPHRNHDREPAGVFVEGPIDDVPALRDRDNPHRSRDNYSHQNHDRDHSKAFEKRPVDDVRRDKDRDNALRSKDTFTQRNHDREPADVFEKKSIDDFHRDRDNLHKSRDTYQNHDHGPVDDAYRDRDIDHRAGDAYQNHDREPNKRGGALCKFFASGHCRNGNRCRFVHEVRERFSPERRSQDDKWGPDHKIESNQVWEGPSWSDTAAIPNNSPLRGWGEKNEVIENEMFNVKESQVTPAGADEFQMQVENPPLQWDTEKSLPNMGLSTSRVVENVSGDMDISVMDSNSHAPSLSNASFATSRQDAVGEAFYEKPFPSGFQDFPMQNAIKEENPNVYHGEGRNVIPTVSAQPNSGISPFSTHFPNQTVNANPQQGFLQVDQSVSVQPSLGLSYNAPQFPSPTINLPHQQVFFPTGQNIGVQPSSCLSPPAAQDQVQFPSKTSYFLNCIATAGPHLVNATPSELVSATAASLSTVSNEQLAQLSSLSASLAQILENQQQLPQLASVTPVLDSTMQTNQAHESSKQQYDPMCDSLDQNVHDSSDPNGEKVLEEEGGNMKQQETVIVSKDDEKIQKIVEGSKKDPENRPTEDEGDDGNKSKDSKVVRPFKFALAEFVKELLKPYWKDGQVNKDAYKTIVKKVVDKIIETQGLQIPQTKEKIDNYLSCSKPKIDKLVQAYVGKFQKN